MSLQTFSHGKQIPLYQRAKKETKGWKALAKQASKLLDANLETELLLKNYTKKIGNLQERLTKVAENTINAQFAVKKELEMIIE